MKRKDSNTNIDSQWELIFYAKELKDNNERKNNNGTFQAIENYYTTLSNTIQGSIISDEIFTCTALTMIKTCKSVLQTKEYQYDNGLEESFYTDCLNKINSLGIIEELDDNELLLIYVKQCIHIMKKSGLIIISNGTASISSEELTDGMLYVKLFDTFWNHVEWKDIFPSDEVAASELQLNKNILIDILLKKKKKSRLEKIANEFFELTGFSFLNDIVMISFLDFYFFTWLRHFGVIKYYGNNYSPVSIEVTEKGKNLLSFVM